LGATGDVEIDIAARTYDELTPTWQTENRRAGESAFWSLLMEKEEQSAAYIHDAWCDRNEAWAAPALLVPYEQLPADEQAKDLAQVHLMSKIVSTQHVKTLDEARKKSRMR